MVARNAGQTPARFVRHACALSIGKPETLDVFEDIETTPYQDMGAGQDIEAEVSSQPVQAEKWEDVTGHRIPVFVFGKITYEDVFSRPPLFRTVHETTYCLVPSEKTGKLIPYKDGNNSD